MKTLKGMDKAGDRWRFYETISKRCRAKAQFRRLGYNYFADWKDVQGWGLHAAIVDDTPKVIPSHDRNLAAMHFATSNLGMPEAKSYAGIRGAWQRCQQAFACEGIDVYDEYKSWLDDINAGDEYVTKMWFKDLASWEAEARVKQHREVSDAA